MTIRNQRLLLLWLALAMLGCVALFGCANPRPQVASFKPKLVQPPTPQVMSAATVNSAQVSSSLVVPRQKTLIWDAVEGAAGYRVYTGPERFKFTNSFEVAQNAAPFQNGIHYGVSTLDATGQESDITPFPSNNFGAFYVEVFREPECVNKVGEFRWLDWQSSTNPQTFLRIVSRLERQE